MQQFPVGQNSNATMQHLGSGVTLDMGRLDLLHQQKIEEDAAGEVDSFNAEDQQPAQGGSP